MRILKLSIKRRAAKLFQVAHACKKRFISESDFTPSRLDVCNVYFYLPLCTRYREVGAKWLKCSLVTLKTWVRFLTVVKYEKPIVGVSSCDITGI